MTINSQSKLVVVEGGAFVQEGHYRDKRALSSEQISGGSS
jgi:hypothetical protein